MESKDKSCWTNNLGYFNRCNGRFVQWCESQCNKAPQIRRIKQKSFRIWMIKFRYLKNDNMGALLNNVKTKPMKLREVMWYFNVLCLNWNIDKKSLIFRIKIQPSIPWRLTSYSKYVEWELQSDYPKFIDKRYYFEVSCKHDSHWVDAHPFQ